MDEEGEKEESIEVEVDELEVGKGDESDEESFKTLVIAYGGNSSKHVKLNK